ncbi:MAG: hypothetical protein K0R49_245 [Burkholderiales bacterium]|jgi:hypothetical protein|nr:hypothetical protein [Burkholderiales bacterium]
MYLMALTNSDYILATLFFGTMFLIAYLFRRKQQSASKFIFAADTQLTTQNNSWIIGFGIIELVVFGAIGAIYGFSGLYYMLMIAISSIIAVYYISRSLHPDSIYEYFSKKVGVKFSASYAILCVIFLLLWMSITVALTSKLFLSLLGWSFVNSVFGIIILTIICIEVGGYAGVKYNRIFWLTIITLAFILILSLGLYSISLNEGLANLQQLALNQGKPEGYYTKFSNFFHLRGSLGPIALVLIIIPLITAVKVSHKTSWLPSALLKLIILTLMILCGILALTITPGGNSNIITYQAQLPDGQMGYIVKAIDTKSNNAKNAVPGIIPPILNDKTGLIEPNKYDYKLASIVVFRHFLPAKFLFILVLTIMALFLYTFSHYLLSIAKIISIDICQPLNLLKIYGNEGQLWCSRMSVIFAGAIGLFGGYFIQQWFNLPDLIYIVLSFAGILVLILLGIIIKYGKK